MRHRILFLFILISTLFKSQTSGTFFSGCGTWTVTKPSCSPGCDAKIIVTLPQPTCYIGGPFTLPYTISSSPNGTCSAPVPTATYNPGTYTISSTACACLGLYFITITDNSNSLFDYANIPINPPSVQRTPTTAANTMSINCAGACTGSVGQTYFNGTSPYSFTINPPGGPTNFSTTAGPLPITNLCAGIMTINVLDAQGCNATFTNNVQGPPAFNWAPVTTSIACFGVCSGAAAVTPTGGTSGYTVNWSTGPSSVIASGQTSSIGGLCAGAAVSASVTDSHGCTYAPFNTTINGPTQVTVVASHTNVSCAGGSNGVASVTVTGGVAPYSYVWSPGPGGNTATIGGLPPGTQTVTISNNSGSCSTTQTFNITGPNAFTINTVKSDVTCAGLTNGSATINITAGSGNGAPYSYTWSPAVAGNTNIASNLGPGVYSVNISDNSPAPGCFTTAVVTITAPSVYTVSAIIQTVTCFGVCNGAASITVLGGTAPYAYNWAPAITVAQGAGTGTGTSLCANNYVVNITDAHGCPTSTTIPITQPPTLVANVTFTNVSCNGGNNGSINSSPTGGNGAPYSFTLVSPGPSTTVATPPFNGLSAGTYTLFVGSGAAACTQSFVVTLTQPNPFIASIVQTNPTCFNVCNGSLSGNVVGGTPGYSYLWNTPTGNVAGAAIGGQCAGNYTLTVTDANGCTAVKTATLTQPSAISATINPTNPSCNGGNNGVLSAVVNGGTPGYTLNWSNGFTGNPDINLFAGTYTLIVTDANGCSAPFTATLTNPAALSFTAAITNPVCAGQCNGSATITASGGTSPYTYQCNVPPVTTNGTGIFSGMCPGVHNINITDANGCSLPSVITLTNPPILSAPVTSVLTTCNICNGGATVTPAGGTPTYAVVWTNSLAVVVGTNAAATNLCAGNYTATVTDAAGCPTTSTVNILQTVNVVVLLAGSGIQCHNACTGSAVATPFGGTLPYTYSWSPTGPPAQTTQTATNLCPGSYTVLVTDFAGCSNTGTISLANPPAINVASSQSNVICNGACNGAITTTVTGGAGGFTYSWSPGGQTTSGINSLCAGAPGPVYTFTATDANNCKQSQSFTITQNPAITGTITPTNPTGCATNNGSICVVAAGGTGGPYTYNWSPGGMTTACVTNLGPGSYSVVISDGSCTNTLVATLTNPTGPTLTINSTSIVCFGANNGSATITAAGTPPYTFVWTPVVANVTAGNVNTASGMAAGVYNISVTDNVNCVTSQTVAITQPPALTITPTQTNVSCNTFSNGAASVLVTGGNAPYSYAWSPVAGGTATVNGLPAGPETVTVTYNGVCTTTFGFNITQPPVLTLTNTFANVKCFNVCTGSIVANAGGGTPGYSYVWSPGGAITSTVTNLCAGVYTVTATDAHTCTAVNIVTITQPASALTSTLAFLNGTCSNSCNATATITGGGGTPVYTYSWTGGPATTSTIGGLCAGNYSGTVTDNNGCTSTQAFSIATITPISATLTPANPLCNGICNGSISTTMSGAQGTVSYVWSPVGAGQNPTNLCAGNYTLTATDASGCQAVQVTSLTNPPALLANVTWTNPSCNASCNGIAVSTPSNAFAPVNYVWTPAAPNSATNSALCAGNYTLTITDGNGCVDTQTNIVLTNPPTLVVNPAVSPATCGSPNGSITLVVAGGTPTFSYVWNPAVAGNTNAAVSLTAGLYGVTVTDANGCTNTLSIPLSNANGPSAATVAATNVQCFGGNNGSANVTNIAGGTPTYAVSWLAPPAPSTVNPQVNLPAGTYTAQITDANACILFTAVTITQPTSITITPNFTLATCNGNCNGIIVLNTSGGTPGYNYVWNPLGPNNSATLTNACAGNYVINITDLAGCTSTQNVNLPATLNMTSVFNDLSNLCSNSCTASSTITPSGGAPPMMVSWSNAQVGNVATNLCAGVYTAMVTDANNCFNTFTTQITSPPALSANASITSPGCNQCNGSATATAVGGTGPAYTYSWSSGASAATASNLCAGLYQVLITDQNLCQQIQNVLISSATGITGDNFNVQNVTCAGNCNGAATVSPVGGTAPITYSWIAPSSTLSSVNGLCAGNYFVQMTDANGCVRTASTSINAANALTISPFVTQPSCSIPNGIISIVPSGGTPGYTINWAAPLAPNTNTTVNGLVAGVYSVTVTDASGCSQTQAFNLSNSTAPVISYTQTNVDCFGTSTGSIVVVGTSTAGPVTYSWSTGNTTQTLTNQGAGVVSLTVTAGGCSAFQTFTFTQNPPMQLSLSNLKQLKCAGDTNAAITLVPSGGTLPYTFTWNPAGSSNPLTSLGVGSYTGIVTDAKGCSTLTSVTFTAPPAIVETNTPVNSSCSTAKDGSVSLTLGGGTPGYTVNWTGPGSFTSTLQNLSNVLAGTYHYTVTDNNGCLKQDSSLIVPTIMISANAGKDTSFCNKNSVILDGSGSVGASAFNWFLVPTPSPTVATTPTVVVAPSSAGSYTYVLLAISSVSTCTAQDTVIVNSLALPIVDAGPSYTIPLYGSVTIGGNPTCPTCGSYTWSPPTGLDNANNPNPNTTTTVNTIYFVWGIDATTGCMAFDSVEVDLYPEIKIPNGFSPNGDNKNDKWIIDNLDQFPSCTVEVYNRWGELLFTSVGYKTPFDGKYHGSDLPVGTYYYVINLNHPAYPKPYTGPLTIFR